MIQLIIQNWIGLLIGLVVAALLCLLVCTKIENKVGASILSIILVLVCAFGGMLTQSYFFDKQDPLKIETNMDILDSTVDRLDPEKYSHLNTVGDFTRGYVVENRPNAPICEDKYASINMAEYNDVVVFYYDKTYNDQLYTVNIIFTKAKNGLVFDGCFNIIMNHNKSGVLWWEEHSFTPTSTEINEKYLNGSLLELSEMWRGDNFSQLDHEISPDDGYHWPLGVTTLPRYYSQIRQPNLNAICGLNFWTSISNNGSADVRSTLSKQAFYLCLNLRDFNFQNIGDLSIQLENNSVTKWINTVYTDIYNSVKEVRLNLCTIDVTDHFYYAEEDKLDSSKATLYNCRTLLHVSSINNGSQNAFKTESIKDDEKINADSVVLDNNTTLKAAPKTTIKLVNTNNTSLLGFDISKAPVTVTFTSNKDNAKTIYVFDTEAELNNGIIAFLPVGGYSVNLESNILSVGNLTSYNSVNSYNKVLEIPFTYEYNTILTSIKLKQLSNLDLSGLDLTANPVTITLNNGTNSYNFIYDSLNKLNEIITKRLPIGTYNYSIVSNELAFSQTSGTLTIDVNNYSFIFNYDYKTNIEYELDIRILMEGEEPNIAVANKFVFWADSIFEIDNYLSTDLKQVVLYDTFNEVENIYELKYIECENDNKIFYGCDLPYIDDLDNYIGTHYYQLQFVFEDDTVIITNVLDFEIFYPVMESYSCFMFMIEPV